MSDPDNGRWTSPFVVDPDRLTPEERAWHEASMEAYRQAELGNWQPGIELGLFPEDAAENYAPIGHRKALFEKSGGLFSYLEYDVNPTFGAIS